MRFLLDTDIVSRVGRAGDDLLTARFGAKPPEEMAISVVTRGEIEFGLRALAPGRDTMQRMQSLLRTLQTLPLTQQVAAHYATIRSHLRAAGTPIGYNDLWIAAHAATEGLVMVTNNEREFSRVPGLKIENWLR